MSDRLRTIQQMTANIDAKMNFLQSPNEVLCPALSSIVACDLESLSSELYSFMSKIKDDFQGVCKHDWHGSCVDHIARKCEICGEIILDGER
jgi:hypothetical protein